ncbi:MAG: glycosyltransferase family 2 protein [Pseudomonadota bacterium]
MNRIALVMIARNEARCIERALRSAQPWVDEMIVLDTGSTDGTPELASACGARVGHFTWVDDFSAARNAALALTEAPWRLVVDADEWLSEGASALAALHNLAPAFIGQLSVSSTIEQGLSQQGQAPSWLSRVLPVGVAYAGRIHEQPDSPLPRRRLPLVLAHDGYLPEQMQAKQGRNAHLLDLALASQPHDAYLQYQRGKDFEVHGDPVQAAAWYDKAFRGAGRDAPWRHDLVLRRLFTLKTLRAFEPALRLAQAELPHWQASPDFYFALGDLFLDWAQHEPHKASELLPMIQSSWEQAVQIGERPELPDTVRGRGSYLAAHNLAVLHESLGRATEAQAWREQEAQMRAAAAPVSPVG